MAFKIKSLLVKNFKCFDNNRFYKFTIDHNKTPIILSGPNGFGKTTFFDAIELVFTSNITRLQKAIENGRTNLQGNILLNKSDHCGTIVVNLTDNNEQSLCIVGIIDAEHNKLTVENSLKFCVIEKQLDEQDEIESFLQSQGIQWKVSLHEFNRLRYTPEHFSVYYYVSQAESVHFLKRTISERKGSINAMLNTGRLDEYIEHIEERLIGASTQRKGVLINDSLTGVKKTIDNLTEEIKSKASNDAIQDIAYQQLLNYGELEIKFNWDNADIDFALPQNNLQSLISEVKRVSQFLANRNDYQIFLYNETIKKLIKQNNINDFCKFSQYIGDGALNIELIRKQASQEKNRVDVFLKSGFFRRNLSLSDYKKDDLEYIINTTENIILSDLNTANNIIIRLSDLSKQMSDNQKILEGLERARKGLQEYVDKLGKDGVCPYCAKQFSDNEELEQAFFSLSEEITSSKGDASTKYTNLMDELKLLLADDCERVLRYIDDIDDNNVREKETAAQAKVQFADSTTRTNIFNEILKIFQPTPEWTTLGASEKYIELERFLGSKIKEYANPNFEEDYNTHNFKDLVAKHSDILNLQKESLTEDAVEKKIKYLQFKNSESKSTELLKLRSQLKEALIKKQKLDNIRTKLDKLKKIYSEVKSSHINSVSEKLRIPLLIYSCKILQDYQNGLGVFINKDELRFVANGDTKHDVINTFSSGQLSGFVLAFLFAMNKQYISEQNDDIGFILIDDPVQTMDDINIASFIEVLRNDFRNKQIILSTHETDKENYILYKFLKYNQLGQSFNVKQRLYV